MPSNATTKRIQSLREHLTKAGVPGMGETEDDAGDERLIRAKLFLSGSRMTYYVLEWDSKDILYGYMVSPLGPDCDEWGYSSLEELASAPCSVRVNHRPVDYYVEADLHWTPTPVGKLPSHE